MPILMATQNDKERTVLNLDPEVKAVLSLEAELSGRKASAVIEDLIRDHLQETAEILRKRRGGGPSQGKPRK